MLYKRVSQFDAAGERVILGNFEPVSETHIPFDVYNFAIWYLDLAYGSFLKFNAPPSASASRMPASYPTAGRLGR